MLHCCSAEATTSASLPSSSPPPLPHHAFHAVRQQQHNAVLADPLGLAGADELVDDALSRVVEISKLGLPQDQSVGTGHGEAQLEACRGDGSKKQEEGEEEGEEREAGRRGDFINPTFGKFASLQQHTVCVCTCVCVHPPRTPYSDRELLQTV